MIDIKDEIFWEKKKRHYETIDKMIKGDIVVKKEEALWNENRTYQIKLEEGINWEFITMW